MRSRSAYHNLMPPACYPFRAAVSGLRLRGSGCERASVEDRSSLPPQIVGARFRARRDSRTSDAVASGAELSRPEPAAVRAALPYSEFSQMMQNEPAADRCRPVPDSRCIPSAGRRRVSISASRGRRASRREPTAARPLRLRVPDTHGASPRSDASPIIA